MQSLKTFELLNTFSAAELDALQRFVEFNAPKIRPEVKQLLAEIRLLKTGSHKIKWTRENVHQLIFPNEEFNDKRIRYLLTDLNKQAQLYLGYNVYRASTGVQQSYISKALAERDCPRSFNAHLNRARLKTKKESRLSPDSYYTHYQIGMVEAEWQITNGIRSSGELNDVIEDLDRFYLVKKLQLCCEALNVSNVLAKEQHVFLLDELETQLVGHPYCETPHISIYLKIIKTITEPETVAHFNALIDLLDKHGNTIEEDDLREMFHYVLNYSIKQINQGNEGHRAILLANYKRMLNKNIIIQNKHISQWHYKNLVTISLRQGEIEFANNFIHVYRKFLPMELRENAFQFNLAYLKFAQHKYGEAIKGLQKVDLDDVYYRLDARSILLKSFYELDDMDTLYYHASSFRTFLRRNSSISEYQKTVYSNLVKLTLALARAGTQKAKLKRVREKLEKDRQVADLQWVEEKLAESEG